MKNYVIYGVLITLLLSACAKSKEEKELKISDDNISIRIEGTVYPSQSQELIAQASGTIKKLYIRYGKSIKKGDIIYELDKELIALDIKNKKIEIQALQNIKKNFQENMANNRDAIELVLAARELKKISFLKSQGYMRDFQENSYKKNYMNAINANKDKNQNDYEKLKGLESAISMREIELQKIYYRLKHANGYANIDGFIAKIDVKNGENIGVDKKICTIVNIDKVIVRAGFATGLLPFIHKNGAVDVSFVTTPPYALQANIKAIAPIVNPSFESMTVDIEVPNSNYILQEGTRALVNIHLSKKGQTRVRKYFLHNKNDRVVQIQSKI